MIIKIMTPCGPSCSHTGLLDIRTDTPVSAKTSKTTKKHHHQFNGY